MLKHIKGAVPKVLADCFRDARDKVQAAKNHYALQAGLGGWPTWKCAASALRVLLKPGKIALFYPERSADPYAAYTFFTWLGYSIVKDPQRRFDVAFKRKNHTFFDPAVLDQVPVARSKIINAGSVDISKRTVGRVFEEVFGYPLAVDPLSYDGPMVEKSDANASHDGRIVEGPLQPGAVRPGFVYQRVVHNLSEDGNHWLDYRVPVHGDQIPFVYLKFRPLEERFVLYTDGRLEETGDVFSPDELEKLWLFIRKMRLDFGEIDVLRDMDGRIYIVDVNNTPGVAVKILPEGERRPALARMAASFDRMLSGKRGLGG